MLGDIERIDPNGVSENRFLDGVANDNVAAEFLTRFVHTDGDEESSPNSISLVAISVSSLPTVQGRLLISRFGQGAGDVASPKSSPNWSTIRSLPLTSEMISLPTISSCPGN